MRCRCIVIPKEECKTKQQAKELSVFVHAWLSKKHFHYGQAINVISMCNAGLLLTYKIPDHSIQTLAQ